MQIYRHHLQSGETAIFSFDSQYQKDMLIWKDNQWQPAPTTSPINLDIPLSQEYDYPELNEEGFKVSMPSYGQILLVHRNVIAIQEEEGYKYYFQWGMAWYQGENPIPIRSGHEYDTLEESLQDIVVDFVDQFYPGDDVETYAQYIASFQLTSNKVISFGSANNTGNIVLIGSQANTGVITIAP